MRLCYISNRHRHQPIWNVKEKAKELALSEIDRANTQDDKYLNKLDWATVIACTNRVYTNRVVWFLFCLGMVVVPRFYLMGYTD